MGPEVMFPLYPPSGAPCRGYVCNVNMITVDKTILFCRGVTRTKRGMWTHLRIVHGIRKQTKLEFESKEEAVSEVVGKAMMAGEICPDCGGDADICNFEACPKK